MKKRWKSYEDAVRDIIRKHRQQFGLEAVEPRGQRLKGETTSWNIDAVGYMVVSRRNVLFEIKLLSRNIIKEQAAGFAFRVEDAGAAGGYFVTPLSKGLTRGAKEIASKTGIRHIRVSEDANLENYVLQFVDKIFAQISDSMHETLEDEATLTLGDENGNPILRMSAEKKR